MRHLLLMSLVAVMYIFLVSVVEAQLFPGFGGSSERGNRAACLQCLIANGTGFPCIICSLGSIAGDD
nr:hypothetical protein BgiMline_014837 [Biomphalaria glabrata]